MAVLHTTRRLLRAVRTHYANRRRDASLRDCDPRLLKDVGLRWERGTLVSIHPERKRSDAENAKSNVSAGIRDALTVCPHCGSKLT